jgi:hypothetical protein
VNNIIEFEPHEVEPNPSPYFGETFCPKALDYHIFKKKFSLGGSNVFKFLIYLMVFIC